MNIIEQYKKDFNAKQTEVLLFSEYLALAKKNKEAYASPAERLLKAIGEPKIVDTSKDARLSRIFGNRRIRQYSTFSDFYGLEEVIERIVSFFKHAAQGLEESRQILYLLGAVGTAKSSLAERLKELMEQEPIYILTDCDGELSPINESPLGLLSPSLSKDLKVPARYLTISASPWALKRLEKYKGDISKFRVTKVYPSKDMQIGISKTEPGDENNQDISTLVGKLDIRKLEFFAQDDPDAYRYSGGLCLSNQGLLEFVEMFKAPIKVLHPLLTATQERNYKGTEAISAIPFDGIVLAHSNESEWTTFKGNKNNEAFLDRIYIVEVPYCLRKTEEVMIYEKLLRNSTLEKAPCAPGTLKMLAEFAVLTRLEAPENSEIFAKMKTYDGENIKSKDAKAKSYMEYKETASKDEGFSGISTRLAYKILSQVYNFDPNEVAADPVHMLYVIEQAVSSERLDTSTEETYMSYLKEYLAPEYAKKIHKDIQTAYLDSYGEYGQSLFDRYILFADSWCEDRDYRDPDTGQLFDRDALASELDKIEKPAEIANPKDFRNEVVKFALRYRADNKGNNPSWKSYEKLRRVIESTMFSKTKDLLPVISFQGHRSKDDKNKHDAFIQRMMTLGYTELQVRRLVEWDIRNQKS